MKKLFLFIFVLFGCADKHLEEKYVQRNLWTCTYDDKPETHMFRSREVSMIFDKVNWDDQKTIMRTFEDHGCKDWKSTQILMY